MSTIVRKGATLVTLALLIAGSTGAANATIRRGPASGAERNRLCSNTQTGSNSDAKSNKVLYVSEIESSVVNVYALKSRKLVATITQGVAYPLGVAVDRTGSLYVVNQGPTSTVTEYAPGATMPERTLTPGVQGVIGVAIDSHGTVYVDQSSPAQMLEFAGGSTTPTKTFTMPLTAPSGSPSTNAGMPTSSIRGSPARFGSFRQVPPPV